jgi:D-lyxose ketol-isomerase
MTPPEAEAEAEAQGRARRSSLLRLRLNSGEVVTQLYPSGWHSSWNGVNSVVFLSERTVKGEVSMVTSTLLTEAFVSG